MTVHHYVASSRELPSNCKAKLVPISETKIKGFKNKELYVKVYETLADFYAVGVSELDGYDEIREKFSNPFVYHLSCGDTRDAYRDLFEFIDKNLSNNESIELYTCMDGDELKEKDDSLNIVVNLKTNHYINYFGDFKINKKRLYEDLSERFWFREGQHVVVTK